uniref:HDOD domain-containing protein n=1 Tax=Meloidogyne hapla TaxID=6305 RepID=A0A1I8BPN6_MELHA
MISRKIEKIRLPIELIDEIANSLPLNLKWEDSRIIDRLTEVKIRFRHYRTNLGAKVKTKVGISSMNKLCNQSLNTIISISALLAEDQPIYATILQGIFIPPLFPLQDNIGVIKGLVSNKLQSILAALTVGIDTIGQESVLSDLYRQLIANYFRYIANSDYEYKHSLYVIFLKLD